METKVKGVRWIKYELWVLCGTADYDTFLAIREKLDLLIAAAEAVGFEKGRAAGVEEEKDREQTED